ncbi:GH36-type glycosyl hydrolase domain-containing protein [Acidisoma sp. L85]|uniref:GH36-type glycosyl hydrolase domain-containing protein n=1 Tax=Acidisoma sp. L85 TaxID=1641850 RepID=UPI001C209C6B|nr:glucoamylase family protein [Acidisoma sp. L85]
MTWLDARLSAQGVTADLVVRDVHRVQSATNVTVRNIITSLRLVSDVDWNDAIEQVSLVDDVLAEESAFREMDFPTRNLYRTAVEELARGADHTETDIARIAVLKARAANRPCSAGANARLADPGYYLFAGGRRAFETEIGFHRPLHKWAARLNRSVGIAGYGTAVAAFTVVLLAMPLLALSRAGVSGAGLSLFGFLGLIPAVDAAVSLVNRAVSFGVSATLLPGLELRDGVPSDLRTLVAIPTLLTTLKAVEEQINRLEIHHLASLGGDLHFALVSDWVDALTEHAEADGALLAAAADGIARLNRQYGPAPGGTRFLLFHRRRVWNGGEARWIGWERKRGKLHELNRLLRAATDTNFLEIDGRPLLAPRDVRYVVTLDADTRLPRDTVRRLIGKMAHPLNRPRVDAAKSRVIEGYGVLQPRVTPSLPVGREGSLFQRIFSSSSGIDSYSAAVSDVYQDLFGEGSYAGKGIYDIDAFEASLAGRVPESSLLSHDLFEGVFARAGLASDIEVIEEFPSRYDISALRHHRWARGDWQLLPWILGRGPMAVRAARMFGAMPPIGRCKMLDNLRRTLSAPVAMVALLAGWTLTLNQAVTWTVFILATIIVPAAIPVIVSIRPRGPGITVGSHLRALGRDSRLASTLFAFTIMFLAHQAWLMGDAIARTLWRLFVVRRHLLEWVPAAQANLCPRLDVFGSYRKMVAAPLIGGAAILLSVIFGRGTWPLVAPFAVLWAFSPAGARWVSRSPRVAIRPSRSDPRTSVLRLTARRTWRFFETFVTSADHMLPPDNFQETPTPTVAHRTSPTNIGLYLLSVASARDLGWIGLVEATERLEATLATLHGLPRFRGHFYNWYGTLDLRPLDPVYISSVDSGNLAGHLIALANVCRDWKTNSFDAAGRLGGIADAIALTHEEARRFRDLPRTQTVTWRELDGALANLAIMSERPLSTPDELSQRLAGLAGQAETIADMARAFAEERGPDVGKDMVFWAEASLNTIATHCRDLGLTAAADDAIKVRLSAIESVARSLALGMDFGFLFDEKRRLLSIGYLLSDNTLDSNCYDLLASEARLASFFAIAKGDVPARHWFRLGRSVTPVARGAALISWSGSMFEYLMPSLIMRAPGGSLFEQTSRLIVRRQIDYASGLDLPWGISESAYNVRDLEFTYQYSNFGVPGLGLKRGLGENRVIAPYATALATMVDLHAASRNLTRLAAIGGLGRYGFYEALDYTPARVPVGERVAIVQAFMAHHQGMTIAAIADALLDGVMRSRFHAEPIIQATELLLQERPPREIAVARPWAADATSSRSHDMEAPGGRRFASAHQVTPATHLLSNGRYALMLTAAGSGYSRWGDLAVTRWREDATCDDRGSYVYLRDVRSGQVWSATFQPTAIEPQEYHVVFNEDRAEFTRRDGTLTTIMDALVSVEDDAEVRRVTITNTGNRPREVEVTSYAELVLAPQAADVSHPAFSKLFVQTEFLPEVGAILATRRRRTPEEPEIWAAHLAVVDGEAVGGIEIETDRARFLGRGRDPRTPIAMTDARPLSNTIGTVLDPVFALRRKVRVAAGSTATVAFWTIVASTRKALLDDVDKHRDTAAFARAGTLAWTQAQVQLNHFGITAAEAGLFQRLAGYVIYATRTLRPSSDSLIRGAGPQSGLWAQGISGDLPIVLLRISDIENLDIARQLSQAHEYWRMKQLAVDLVILNERQSSYVQDLQVAIDAQVRTSQSRWRTGAKGPSGRVFVLRADLIPPETKALLGSAARVVFVAQRGSLFDQLDRIAETGNAARAPTQIAPPRVEAVLAPVSPKLEFFNGLGGFADGGKEYVTILGPGLSTPAPWINVIANPTFGFQVAADGGGYTWSANSREYQLTPWSNDPVTDPSGEVLYLRDDESGDVWTPTALPMRDEGATYIAHHGRGYTRFKNSAHGVDVELLQYVPIDAPVKISRLILHNRSRKARRLSVTAYVEWVLAPSRSSSLPFVTTEIDPSTGAIFARNPWNMAFPSRVAFADLRGGHTSWTGDRREFIGRNGTLANPAALSSAAPLSKTVGAGLDPCGALRRKVEVPANGSVEIAFFLGDAASVDEARNLITHYRTADLGAVLAAAIGYWDDALGKIEIKTPDRSMDIMTNGWLLYQTLACRVWARSAFYQASGAYGFRDQLQDGMALAVSRPALTREHLLRAAARQFVEGDVQHWWLPHSGQGVRTRISDDRAWLAYAVGHYLSVTAEFAVLDEPVAFLEGQALRADEHDAFFLPAASDQTASLFEHCALALDHSLAVGDLGLPLMGTGDWNDGMNRVGEGGKGQSVWLGWFLHAALTAFIPIARNRGEKERAVAWETHAVALQASLEREAWDGDWYRRGFFDDGTALGSAGSLECQIDSIAQSWAVLSGASKADRASHAMAFVKRDLIRPQDGLALLFAPPFDKTPLDPGYIKGYPPGIRENGGQYTHAALWSVMAFAALGDGDEAASLFALLNPINHSHTRADVYRYKVEPYVVSADVYAMPPHVGRGGWTWYTGSAGWMYRAATESILGLHLLGEILHLEPCIPKSWPGFEIRLRHGSASYEIRVENPAGAGQGIVSASIDGKAILERPFRLKLVDDGAIHRVQVGLGAMIRDRPASSDVLLGKETDEPAG